MFLLVLFLTIALGVSFICSMLESVILSVSLPYIALLIKDEKKSGHLLGELKKNIDHPLAAILTLNTVANVVGAAGVGAQTYHLFGSKWVAVSSATLTILILVFSEIIPKSIGAAKWKKIAPFAAYVLKALIIILYPVVVALEKISSLFSQEGGHGHISREELMVLAELGEDQGILLKKEARIIQNLLLLRDIQTKDVLTPRNVVLTFQAETSIGDIFDEHSPINFSRIPVYGENSDDIKGIVFRNELVEAYYSGNRKDSVVTIAKPVHAIPDSKSIADILDEFISRREHIFIVVDEYGGTAGIVTLEDAIETLLGVEIVDEVDSVEDMRAFALEAWKKRRRGGRAPF